MCIRDRSNPDFEKEFDIDVTHKLRHIGILEKTNFEAVEMSLLNEKGEPVDDAPFIMGLFDTCLLYTSIPNFSDKGRIRSEV